MGDILNRLFRLAILPAVITCAAAPVRAQDAAAPIRSLYAKYGIGPTSTGTGFRERDAAGLFSADLLALYRRASKSGLDYDFFVQGQDFNLAKPIEVTHVDTAGDRATVTATLTQNDDDGRGRRKLRIDRFTFAVVQAAKAWKIDNATHDGSSFRRELRQVIRSGGTR